MRMGIQRATVYSLMLLACAAHAPTQPPPALPLAPHDAPPNDRHTAAELAAFTRALKDTVYRAWLARVCPPALATSADTTAMQTCILLKTLVDEHAMRQHERQCGNPDTPLTLAVIGLQEALARSHASALENGLSKHPTFAIVAHGTREQLLLEHLAWQQHDAYDRTTAPIPGHLQALRAIGVVSVEEDGTRMYARARLTCLETGVDLANARVLLTTEQATAVQRERQSAGHALRALYETMRPDIEAHAPTPRIR